MSEAIPTESWEKIEEFPNYAVSNLARIKRITHPVRTAGGIIKQHINQSGYWEVTLKHGKIRKRRQVHRLLALAFLPPDPPRDELNHKNGVRHDTRLENLEWVTHQENMWHAYNVLDGQALRGEEATQAKLKENDIHQIRELLKSGMTLIAIGKLFGVSGTAIYYIKSGRNWKHVTP
jgi:hypothetical protein